MGSKMCENDCREVEFSANVKLSLRSKIVDKVEALVGKALCLVEVLRGWIQAVIRKLGY
jgi:hypothetical protein